MSFSSLVKNELKETKIKVHCQKAFDYATDDSFFYKNTNFSICCKRAYLKGFFISNGAITDPKKSYHMQFSSHNINNINLAIYFFSYFSIFPKIIKRKSITYLYLKESESISNVLRIMGASKSLMHYENCRITKEVNNQINRLANFETANTDKILNASANHILHIKNIQNKVGLNYLPQDLYEIAILRLENPLFSLYEIGDRIFPKLSKSVVSRKFKKIESLSNLIDKGEIK